MGRSRIYFLNISYFVTHIKPAYMWRVCLNWKFKKGLVVMRRMPPVPATITSYTVIRATIYTV